MTENGVTTTGSATIAVNGTDLGVQMAGIQSAIDTAVGANKIVVSPILATATLFSQR